MITAEHDFETPRIAASHYLNSAPLIWTFLKGPHKAAVDLLDAVPARCARLLENGEADVALVPVIEYQRIPDLVVVPDVCVGSRRKVRSVVLASKRQDLREVKSVALDESSRTSATLVKIIFKEFIGREPEWKSTTPNLSAMLSVSDAALIIGDPAMNFARENLNVFDLASLWHEYTGLGLIFALWMKRKDSSKAGEIDFSAVRDSGLERIEEIVSAYEPFIAMSREELVEYLTENISYRIDTEMSAGLKRYFELAYKHSLIPELKPLVFIGEGGKF
jgi:chorismate dehydratase